jgi:hypothetical protein
MKKGLYLLLGLGLVLSACTQRMICPAYQSSFIYDKESLRKKFSYFKEDSTPKILTASKSKYLIAVPESYRKKMRNMQTVEMKPVYPVIPDSLKLDHEKEQLMAERDVIIDSTAAPMDSVYAITKTKEKYNVDQDIYMWYFRETLVLPDVRAAMEQKKKTNDEKSAGTGKKKGLFSFLKRKEPKDSLAINEVEPADSVSIKPAREGLFKDLFKKNKSTKPKEATPKKDPAKKEDENDGFQA